MVQIGQHVTSLEEEEEYRCAKCGAAADERWACCEVFEKDWIVNEATIDQVI